MKWFAGGSATGEDYQGERTSEAIIKFIEEKGTKRSGSKSHVVSLTPKDFDSIVMNPEKSVMVKFFAPWCGHCKLLAPDYEKVSGIFARDNEVLTIAEVDCDAHRELCEKYSVTGFPTLKFFAKGAAPKTPEDYNGGRAVADFVLFLNNKCNLQRTETGILSDQAGRIPELDQFVASFMKEVDKKAIIKKAKEAVEKLEGAAKKAGKWYLKAMETVAEKGNAFIANEKARLTGVIEGKSLSESKLDEFTIRRNILGAF